ncbi:Rod shape-determining protein MreD [Reichenbachiella ulvae]|uniref:Rod shape-determining protein MreD n=1 Tax=Reichenbachiella ulvae TaxID=2980104 RepID=A0ABT3CYK6_9BACT|nr:Rod shape-determining protein MreD [Reichenbachiella ulvae]MCV9388609.1 Rod shape-determining protein MreD [Reichenbachiella ulvae]
MGRFKFLEGLISVIFLILGQVLLFKHMVLFDTAFCFAYLMIFLLIPIDTGTIVQLVLAFVVGLIVDVFYNTLGIHAAACLGFVFLKIYWSEIMTPSGGYDTGAKINVRYQGLRLFLMYTYPLVLLHSLLIFFIEASGFDMFWRTMGIAFYSSLFTMVMILIIQYLFYRKIR